MESDKIALHVMSLISEEMSDSVKLADACKKVNAKMKILMPNMYEGASRDMINQALDLMVELGQISECPNWE